MLRYGEASVSRVGARTSARRPLRKGELHSLARLLGQRSRTNRALTMLRLSRWLGRVAVRVS